jgi:hypothetical protein
VALDDQVRAGDVLDEPVGAGPHRLDPDPLADRLGVRGLDQGDGDQVHEHGAERLFHVEGDGVAVVDGRLLDGGDWTSRAPLEVGAVICSTAYLTESASSAFPLW